MGIELRMWYYDTLDCTNIYIYVIQSAFLARRNLMRVSQIHQTNRRPSIHRVLLVSVLFASHTHIYMYSTGVWAEISTVNLHTFNAIAFYCNHSHRPQCRYITGPQDIYIYIQRYTHYICFIDCVSFTKTQMPFECPVTYLCLFSPRRHRM